MFNEDDLKYFKIFNDSPIENAEYFNFDAYINAICNIIEYPENTTPFSIVINGKWGSGKTSLMKSLQNKLDIQAKSANRRKIRTVWFNAWKYSETDSILASLVREIYDEISQENIYTKQGLRDRVKLKVMNLNEQVDPMQQFSDLAKILSLGLSPDLTKWQTAPAYEEYLPFYNKFQKYLELILTNFVISKSDGEYDDKKGVLVIFIDDLDRCSPRSVAKILETINLFFDQKGCIFVFGMDTNLIAKTIKAYYSDLEWFSGENYIKKMIQLQLDLPEIRKQDLKTFIEKEIDIDKSLNKYIDIILEGSESNPRQIKQYINSLRLMMALGKSIENLDIEEELLIKWSILNLISGSFIDKIKRDLELFLRFQVFAQDPKHFDQWEKEKRSDFFSRATDEEVKKDHDEFQKRVIENSRIINILKYGDKRFTEENLDDYIYLSSITPKSAKFTDEELKLDDEIKDMLDRTRKEFKNDAESILNSIGIEHLAVNEKVRQKAAQSKQDMRNQS